VWQCDPVGVSFLGVPAHRYDKANGRRFHFGRDSRLERVERRKDTGIRFKEWSKANCDMRRGALRNAEEFLAIANQDPSVPSCIVSCRDCEKRAL